MSGNDTKAHLEVNTSHPEKYVLVDLRGDVWVPRDRGDKWVWTRASDAHIDAVRKLTS